MDLSSTRTAARRRWRLWLAAGTALVSAAAAGVVVMTVSATVTAAVVAPGKYTGPGFDTCSAPTEKTMQAWRSSSPYRAIGIYIGGVNRGCNQPNLTASWVANQNAAGWHLLPLYVGLQAPCATSTRMAKMDPAKAAAQGTAAAQDAVAQARALGLSVGSAIVLDMEAYQADDAACRTAVQTFVSAWTARLHTSSYLSGLYGKMPLTIGDQVSVYQSGSLVHPDYLFFARWDSVATVADTALPAGYWEPQRRIKQYKGDHTETYGGVTINIDNDYFDIAPVPATPFGDFGGNGWSDLLTRDATTNQLRLYSGNGSVVTGPTIIGSGWGGMDSITRFGDFTGDGAEDLIGRDAATGYLWLYPGNGAGTGFKTRVKIGQGWTGMREITPVGDVDGDGFADLLAVGTATGKMTVYRGKGTGFSGSIAMDTGWETMDELTGVGDINGDRVYDLVARETASGDLYLYPGAGGRFGDRVKLASGWGGMRDLVGVGDIDRDGHPDLLGVQRSTGKLTRYLGDGTGFGDGVSIGTGWGKQLPLL